MASFVKWDPELSHLALDQKKSVNLSHASTVSCSTEVCFIIIFKCAEQTFETSSEISPHITVPTRVSECHTAETPLQY